MKLIGLHDTPEGTVITPWSLVHLLSGCAAKQLGFFNTAGFFVAHGIYEVKDRILDSTTSYIRSLPNSIGDQAFAMTGFILTKPRNDSYWILFYLLSLLLAVNFGVEADLDPFIDPNSLESQLLAEHRKPWQQRLWEERHEIYGDMNQFRLMKHRKRMSLEGLN